MKKIIGGKSYNTETADHIGGYSNSLGRSDFRFIDEDLYKTKKGQFFLAGEGGAMTKYSQPAGNMTSGGSNIFVLDEVEAREWCENHDIDPETIEQYFSIEEG